MPARDPVPDDEGVLAQVQGRARGFFAGSGGSVNLTANAVVVSPHGPVARTPDCHAGSPRSIRGGGIVLSMAARRDDAHVSTLTEQKHPTRGMGSQVCLGEAASYPTLKMTGETGWSSRMATRADVQRRGTKNARRYSCVQWPKPGQDRPMIINLTAIAVSGRASARSANLCQAHEAQALDAGRSTAARRHPGVRAMPTPSRQRICPSGITLRGG